MEKGKEKSAEPENEADGQEPSTKRAKLDLPLTGQAAAEGSSKPVFEGPKEEVLDDRLCTLSHEQLELLITRLARSDPTLEERIVRQIERLEHSMSMFSPRRTEVAPAGFLSPRGSGGAPMMMMSPHMMMAMGGMGMGGMSPRSPFRGGGFDDDFGEEINIKAIRRKVRSAFQKLKDGRGGKKRRRGEDDEPQKYHLQADLIRKEVKKAKDCILLKNDHNNGLDIMEAITDEFVNFGSEAGTENVDGYDDALHEIAQDWVDLFLAEGMDDFLADSRMDWVNKLFVWDKSADEAEGTFSAARAAAKLGWKDVHLQQVLAGDHIGKYTEPEALSIVRCNILEREKKLEQALNLARAVDLHHFTARYLIKLGKMDEAIETARGIEDPSKIFTIAQVARSMDVKVAFALAVYAISLPHEWNVQNNERALWLCDLAISQNMLNDLVTEAEKSIKHKAVQFEIAKILKDKTAYKAAQDLAAIVLKPWPKPEPKEEPPKPTTAIPSAQQIAQLVNEIDPGSIMPRGVARWMWELSYEMILLEVGTKENMSTVVDLILEYVDEVDQLLQLAQDMSTRQEYELIIRIGEKCFTLSNEKLDKDLEEQAKIIREQFDAILKKATPPQVTRAIGYNQQFDRQILNACNTITTAALNSKIPPDPMQAMITPIIKIIRQFSPLPQERIKELAEICLKHLKDPTQIIQYAKTLMTRKEYELVLVAGRVAQERLKELDGLRLQREEWLRKLGLLQQEQAELLLKRKNLPDEKQEEMNGLLLKKELLRLEPYYTNYSESQLDNLQLAISQLVINSCITSTLSEDEKDRMSEEQITAVVIEQGVASPHLPNINHRLQLLRDLKTNVLRYFPAAGILLQVAPLVQDNVEELRKGFLERTEITVPLQILQEEQNEILNQAALKKRKDVTLPPEKLARLEDLAARLSMLPPAKYYEPTDCNSFDSLNEQIAQLMLSTAVETRQQLEEEKWLPESKIDDILTVCLQYCQDPNHLKNFMNVLKNATGGRIGEFIYEFLHGYDMAIMLAEKTLHRIDELEAARAGRFDAHFELKELEREKAEAEQNRKTLTEEQEARIEQLNLEHKLERSLSSKYHFSGCNVNEKLKLQIFQIIQACALDNKRKFEQKIETDIESFTPEMIAEGREQRQKQMDRVVEVILKHAHDPSHLVTVGNAFSSNKETLLVDKFARRVLELVPELEKERREREKWQAELSELSSEEAELKSKKKALEPEQEKRYKELRRQNLALKMVPSYKTQSWKVHDDYLYSAATMVINSILNDRDRLETHVSQSESEYDKDEVANQMEGIIAQLDKAVAEMVEKHVLDPSQLYSIAHNFYNRGEYDRVLPIAIHSYNRVQEVMKLREDREIPQQWVSLLTAERDELAISKKDLSPKQLKHLEECEAQVEAFEELPQYAKQSFDSLDQQINQLSSLVLRNALDSQKKFEEKLALEGSQMETDDTDLTRVQCQKRVDDAMEFCLTKVKSPQQLSQLTTELAQRGEYELLLRVAAQCQLRIKEVNAIAEERLASARERERLQTLEAELIHSRKALEAKQKERLRQLRHEELVRNSLFLSYEHVDTSRNDSISQNICLKMIEAILQLKEDTANKDAMDDDLSASQVDKKVLNFKQRIEEVVDESIKNVENPRNLFAIAQKLHSRLEYGLAIKVGARCQERIQFLVDQNEERADLNQKISDLNQQQVVSPSDSQKEEIERLSRKLQELPVTYEDTSRLNSFNLQVANMMIEAAKVEERPDVLRDQAILRFKIQPTIPLFEEVRIMTEADEWAEVKKQLMEYILKPEAPVDRSSFGFGYQTQTIDPKAKMELLLNEGMWKETAKIFPEPPYGSLEMLERLFLEVERNDPDSLDELLPVIEKYAVHFYQSYALSNPSLDRLLDQVQKRAPDFVYGLFSRGAEKLLLTVLPKQYSDFVSYLQLFRKRLEDMGRDDDWATFISDLVKRHKGKRKLMQLIQNAGLKE